MAVKVLRASDPAMLASLERETLVLRLLRLPGVVHLLDERLTGSQPFVVMPFVEGRPFPGAGGGRVSWEAIEETTLALAESLSRIHALGVVHRDLKPSNVLVDENGVPQVLDFGISHGADWGYIDAHSLGTPTYLAPEQARGEVGDARADLYALGTMIYEALAGCLPFDATDVSRLLLCKQTEAPVSLGERVEGVPEHVVALVDAMLERHPEDRPASAQHVAAELRGAARDVMLPRLLNIIGDAREVRVEALANAFHGIEWGLRERTRAAQVVLERVAANPRAIAKQLAAWVRSGRLYWDDERLRFAADQLETLERGGDQGAVLEGTDLRSTLPGTQPGSPPMALTGLAKETLPPESPSEQFCEETLQRAPLLPPTSPLLEFARSAFASGDVVRARQSAFAAARGLAEWGEDDALVDALTLGTRAVFQRQPTVAELDEALYRFDSLAHRVASGHPAQRLLLAARETLAANRETALELLRELAGELPPELEMHRLGFELRNRLRLEKDEREVLSAFESACASARNAGMSLARPLVWMANFHGHHERYTEAFACFERALSVAATDNDMRFVMLAASLHLPGAVGLNNTESWLERTAPAAWAIAFDSTPSLDVLLSHVMARLRIGEDPALPTCLNAVTEIATRAEGRSFLLPIAGAYWRLGRLPEARILAESSLRSAASWRFDDGVALARLVRMALGAWDCGQEPVTEIVSTLRLTSRAQVLATGLALAAMLSPASFTTPEIRVEVDAALSCVATPNFDQRLVLLTPHECMRCVRGEFPEWFARTPSNIKGELR